MNKATIQQLHSIKQDAKEGIFTMKGITFTRLLHTLIREYGNYSNGSFSVDPKTFSISDKKLILSHITSASEYEWACKNNTRTEAVLNEYIDHIQKLLDNECDEVYRDDMEEAGLVRKNHYDNDEVYWTRR